MGKSTACLKIIACGHKDSVDRDDLEAPETTGYSDRRGWSFRKRSSRHRVLSNTANSEIANKESPESHIVNFQTQPDLAVQEKTSPVEWTEIEEKRDLPAPPASNLLDTQKEDQLKEDLTIDESCVITIQAAIRGFLARKLLSKQNSNVIKLQAAVRGHLVRTHAVGTLRCVQAIIKMQALVRARCARLDNTNKKETKSSGTHTYVSIDKLLSNTFARQLMETTPRTQSIRIKCEPLKSDSSWKWLERWMSVSSVSNEESHESSEPTTEHPEKETLDCSLISSDNNAKISVEESEDDDDALISREANNADFDVRESMSPNASELQNTDESNIKHDEQESDYPSEIRERDLSSGMEEGEEPIVKGKEAEVETHMPDLKSYSSTEQPETEAKKFARKASNPAFIAAQSKFEELSSAAVAKEITSASGNDYGANPGSDKVNDSADEPSLPKDSVIANDISISNAPIVQTVGSECGTELSITSTLDSPDNNSDSGVIDFDRQRKISDGTRHHISQDLPEIGAKGSINHSEVESNDKETDPSHTDSNKVEKCDNISPSINGPVDPVQEDEKPLANENDLKLDAGSEVSHMAYKSSSPNASPRSHITLPESQTTPSSQVSVNKRKKSGGEKTKSNGGKAKSSSSGDKKAHLNRNNQDSASKNSSDQKTGKRQAKEKDHDKEHEARDSSSSNSLPSYMQATESARAKAISNGSPRSSPDVHDKDAYLKKRHSLPGGAHERQGSPRIHRSLSQATQQGAKGNGTQSPQDRKWRR